VEGLVMTPLFWRSRRVFITGHTGFKGGWLSLWLNEWGAEVHGYALTPTTEPNFFSLTDLATRLSTNTIADIRDRTFLVQTMHAAQPEVVFHFAAQSLVRHSYAEPVETYATNVMGTINLLEAARKTSSVKAIVIVTSDKCYENREWVWPYREIEPLGGYDPYSSSKACAELVTAAWRRSFLAKANIHVASVRAGNVIGGGDWSPDRLVPDFIRAYCQKKPLRVRSPHAIRPWQHVLEPLHGYLLLAEKLYTEGEAYAEAWNFGPDERDEKPVQWVVDALCAKTSSMHWVRDDPPSMHEAHTLRLDSTKARTKLGWLPRWNLERALDETWRWYEAWLAGKRMVEISLAQIDDYLASGKNG
jgi:CDP-glucose 4,6-dehydratase